MAGVWDVWSDMRPEPETEPLKPEKEGGTQRPRRRNLAATVGIALMGLSLALWVSLPAVPFLPLSVGGRGDVRRHARGRGGGRLLAGRGDGRTRGGPPDEVVVAFAEERQGWLASCSGRAGAGPESSATK